MSVLERWMIFLINSSDQAKRKMVNEILKSEEGISMAAETLLSVSKDENERARLLNEYRIILDYQSGLSAAAREGEKKGEQKGLQKGTKLASIKSAVNVIKTLKITVAEAVCILELDPEYHDNIVAELKKQDIFFIE